LQPGVYVKAMKRSSAFCALCVIVFAAVQLRSQETRSEPSIPVDQEPQHKVVFKNDFVRVIDATLPSGYKTLNHAHDVDSVSVNVATGREGEAGQRGLGRAAFSKGGYSHVVTNSNPAIMRYIVVEIGKSDHPGAVAVQQANHTLETENERMRIYRVKLDSGESIAAHSHPAGWVEVVVKGAAGPGPSRWNSAGSSSVMAAGNAALEVVEIEPR
jgi:hypothetical protein